MYHQILASRADDRCPDIITVRFPQLLKGILGYQSPHTGGVTNLYVVIFYPEIDRSFSFALDDERIISGKL
jgi:hypothetical protein